VVAFVVDNSVVVAWLYAGQANAYTERVLEISGTSTLHTSFIWPAEFANAATVMVQRGILTDSLGTAMIQMTDTFGLLVDRTPVDLRALYQMSRRFGLSAYDASYLELAMRLNIPLATTDTALMKASQTLGLFVA